MPPVAFTIRVTPLPNRGRVAAARKVDWAVGAGHQTVARNGEHETFDTERRAGPEVGSVTP
jgi:hypothetical protein